MRKGAPEKVHFIVFCLELCFPFWVPLPKMPNKAQRDVKELKVLVLVLLTRRAKTREMLKILEVFGLTDKNVLKTREVLTMLEVLGVLRPRSTPNTHHFEHF